jgi:hypothetical protein
VLKRFLDDFVSFDELKGVIGKESAKAIDRVLSNLAKHPKLQLPSRDKMRKFKGLHVGDLVLLKEPKVDTQAKIKPKFQGPFQICARVGPSSYKIKNVENGKKLISFKGSI